VAILFAGTQGLLDDVKVESIRAFEDGFHKYLDSAQTSLLKDIGEKKALDDDLRAKLKDAINEFKQNFFAEHQEAQVASGSPQKSQSKDEKKGTKDKAEASSSAK
jgi:F-type H+-transporting ATPase subunit alpha